MSRQTSPHSRTVARVNIRKHPVSDLAASVRSDYETKYGSPPEDPGGWFHPDDWNRVSWISDALRPGGKLLDVGVGAGQFLNMLARSGRWDSVTGVDKTFFNKYSEFEPNMSRTRGNVADLDFEDDSFDVVTCMEVLEHVPEGVMLAGMEELRRVCRGQLIMSVPFCEPEPISKTHVRRFLADDILELFPDASLSMLDRPRMPWMIMEERFDGTEPAVPGDAADGNGAATLHELQAEVEGRLATKVAQTKAQTNEQATRLVTVLGDRLRSLVGRNRR